MREVNSFLGIVVKCISLKINGHPRVIIEKQHKTHHELASSWLPGAVEEVPLAAGRDAEVGLGRSLLLSRLWKKFCNTSCCVCPPAAVGLGEVPNGGDEGCLGEVCVPNVVGLPVAVRPVSLLAVAASGILELDGPLPLLLPISISDNAFTTFGRLKLLLPSGPTTPAAAPSSSAGLRKAPRGSRSAFLRFSS